jgi:folate-dependent phosphoribosylglycinamide formyltransferase PurN
MSQSEHDSRREAQPARPRMVLICHHDEPINREALPHWLASFTDLAGIVVIRERPEMVRRRARREIERVGYLRFLDVVAFRLYYRLKLAAADRALEMAEVGRIKARYPEAPRAQVLETETPNSEETRAFLQRLAPDLVLARCKFILKRQIFEIPRAGTLVLHPGICPEYRNAHGCFWALANRDLDKVGVTLLRVDPGIDTGPVYGYFTYPHDEAAESHITIQTRVVTENLDAIADAMTAVHRGEARAIDTSGRRSGVWGQPWLTKYLGWKRAARRGAGAAERRAGVA